MASDRWQRVQELFEEALSREPADTAMLLDEACGDDTELREEVESLLSHYRRAADTFMQVPDRAAAGGFPEIPRVADPLVGQDVAGYRITTRISIGGMGIVYEAEQEHPKRTVALKVISAGRVSPELLRRFEHEAQILATLDHPGIAHVFEAGTFDVGHGPQPFFAMEFVKGMPLVEYPEAKKLSTRKRLGLLAKVADAVQHAHQKGVIHRDLKPGNILVTDAGEPKILDFGVARVTGSDVQTTTLRTDIGQLIGTVPYMSPEQATGDPSQLDMRSDVYSIGVVAYELLAGRYPYEVKKKMIHEAVRVIREDDPAPLSSIDRVFRGDIEIIVAKALEKERERRYQTVGEFATDIRRFLSDEPIVARPPSTWYQVSKFTKRNRALVGAVLAILVVLVAGVVGTSIGLVQAVNARRAEAEQRRLAERRGKEARTHAAIALAVNEFLNNDLLAAVAPEQQGRSITMRQVLDTASTRVETRFPDKPLIEAAVRMTLGNTYKSLGEYDAAERHIEEALRLRRSKLGGEHSDTLSSINDLAIVYEHEGRYAEAEPLYLNALAVRRRTLGEYHARTLDSMNNLANLYRYQGRYADAEPLYRKGLEATKRTLGDAHPDTISSMSNLAALYTSQGRHTDAAAIYEKTLAWSQRVQGEDHRDTLKMMSNLGAVFSLLGRYDDAEPLLVRSLEGRRRTLGEDHPETLVSTYNLGKYYDTMGLHEQALGSFTRAVAGARRSLPEEHWHIGRFLQLKGKALTKLKRYGEAEPVLLEAHRILVAALGEDHPTTLDTVNTLAEHYHAQGKLDEARRLVGQLIAARKNAAEEPDADAAALNEYAWLLLTCEPTDLRDPTAALAAAKKANEISGGPNPGFLDTLALAYHLNGDTDKARDTQHRAVSLLPPGGSPLRSELEARLAEYDSSRPRE